MAVYASRQRSQIIVNAEYGALVPRPTEDEYRLLKEDIQANGINVPLVVNSAYVLLDGYTRMQVAEELDIRELTVKVESPRDELAEREYVIRANLSRRHLTGAQKDKLGLALLGIERERAAARLNEAASIGGKTAGRSRPKPHDSPSPTLGEGYTGKAVEKAAKAVGRSAESIRKAERIEHAIGKHPEWAEVKNQWEQAQAGKDTTEATYRTLRTLETESLAEAKFGDLQPEVVTKPPAPPSSGLRNVVDDIVLGDCRVELSVIPADSIHLIVTSPPYADARASTYGGVTPERYVEWFLPIADELRRVLRPDGSFVLVVKEGATDGERDTYVLDLVLALKRQGWRWVEEYHWCKKNAMPGKWPNRFQDRWEHVFHFAKERKFAMYQKEVREPIGEWAKTRLKNLSESDTTRLTSATRSGFGRNMSRWVGKKLVYPSNSLHIAPEAGHQGHSAAFPERLPAWFIRLFTKKGDVVLDPFAGSGTTAVAALMLGRHYIGIEQVAQYRNVAVARVAKARQRLGREGPPASYFAPVSKVNGGDSDG